jgi:serine/threonine protein kinase
MAESFAQYEILGELGAGGMGVLYRARDTRLQRIVALKRLKPEASGDPERRRRLIQEARSASSLNHPHVVTIYEIGQDPESGDDFIAMELVEGESLHARLARGRLDVDEALRLATEIASGLAAAHAAGIVHRDIKPSNVMITREGHAKMLDFGLAKHTVPLADSEVSSAPTLSEGPRTGTGAILGTPAYMSPEQAHGRPVDARTDVFAFGLLLYEALTGERAMRGETTAAVISAILRDDPVPVRSLRPEVDRDVEAVVDRCLVKAPEARYPDAAALLRDLEACRTRRAARRLSLLTILRRPAYALPLAALAIVLVVFTVVTARRLSRERWARQEALPGLVRLADEGRFVAAYRLGQQIRPVLADDPQLEKLWNDVTFPVNVTTDPPGAEISFKPYGETDGPWERLGISPLEEARIPLASFRWRIVKDGYETREVMFFDFDSPTYSLVPEGDAPPGMIPVPGGSHAYRATPTVDLPDYWLDRYEVTNRDFQRFVDEGGYERPEFWKQPFVKAGRRMTFEEAMAGFQDTTGRSGPSTWELGRYPEGQGDLPVGGVSWYEAAAYAEYAERSLPSFHHWYRAAGAREIFSDILGLSNFGGAGPAPIGSHEGLSPWGHYDMAGNVREWVWNAAGARRYTLGGAWNDPTYLFTGPDALDPFDRSATLGFRCALYPTPPPEDAFKLLDGDAGRRCRLRRLPQAPLLRPGTSGGPCRVRR